MTLVLMGCGVGSSSSAPTAVVEVPPRAACAEGGLPETALQGQVTQEDRTSGRSAQGYSCNLELVGQSQGEGASWQHAWFDDCAYYSQSSAQLAQLASPGVIVVNVANPATPVASGSLDTPAMTDPWESLKVNEQRALLGAVHGAAGALTPGTQGPEFDVYDVSGDCAQPQLLSTTAFPDTLGHEGDWAPDGLTYYGTNGTGGGSGQVNAIDVTDPLQPTLIFRDLSRQVHGLAISDDGNRGYFASFSNNGLQIVDLSAIQSRAAAPVITPVGAVAWEDGTLAQHAIPFTRDGKPYLVFVDEGGHGAARIIDISNEALPVVVSKLKLEVHLPENCAATTPEGGCNNIFVYDGHYCGIDRAVDTTAVACGYFESGVRVFDIRDVANPKEIAYYNPPALAEPGPGSQHGGGTADRCTSQVRFVPERRELWTTCQDNGFVVLRFADGVWPFAE
ncbi:MAG TPA: hypothetical protein VM240_09700 [Verrucomicrobiae bacterium]|nr:hypothetical protein [Verrucomicrobiae bacterium]